jgi:hypothetical protein
MGLILLAIINASVFSIGGLGEDLSVFSSSFTDVYELARIDFSLKPEFNVLNKDGDFRAIFWSNPFNFSITAPVTKGFIVGCGNLERFNQSFDVYYEHDELNMHVNGEGGIEEFYVNLSNNFKVGEIALRGSYLFGNASEVWNYTIGDYYLVDSFQYKYHGKIFCGGLRIKFVSVFFETFGDIIMEKQDSDTTIDLPQRLSISLNPEIFKGKVNVIYEHSFWSDTYGDYRSPHRFRISFQKQRLGVGYMYNPWYLKNITEHGLDFSFDIPIHRLGSITLNLCCALRNKDSLREIKFLPEIKLTLKEIFARRRR